MFDSDSSTLPIIWRQTSFLGNNDFMAPTLIANLCKEHTIAFFTNFALTFLGKNSIQKTEASSFATSTVKGCLTGQGGTS
jgi:hypothetical protein